MGMELPVIQNQLENPGYDPVTAAAIRRSGMDTANTAFDAAKFSADRRAGATGNEAAFYGSNNDMALKRAEALSRVATGAEEDIGKQKLHYGEANKALAQTNGPFDWFNSILTAGRQGAAAAAGALQRG